MFSSTWVASAPSASLAAHAAPDVYDLAQAYGSDAAAKLSRVLQALETAGFPKAHVNSYSAFDRVLSGIAWLLQRIVKREDSDKGRVQWDVLFQSHDKMKPRLGLAQEAVRCIEALSYDCPVPIQPHQLLLQDFGDIETVQKLVLWLVDESQEAQHLEKIRRERAFLQVMSPQEERKRVAPLKNEVEFLLDTYAPKRRWQYVAAEGEAEESEDALIQRCLLEYGERVTVAVEEDETTMETKAEGKNQVDFMAQIASQAAAIASGGASRPRGGSMRGLRRTKRNDPHAADFDRQYQQALKLAKEEQQTLLNQRRQREAKLLQRVVSAPVEKQEDIEGRVESSVSSPLYLVRAQLKEHKLQVQQLIQEKTSLDDKSKEGNARAAALDEALSVVKQEMAGLRAQTPKDENAQAHLSKLRQLVMKNEALKREKNEFRTKCRLELEALKERVENLKLQVAEDASNQDEETLRLNEIKQMHTQMAQKHKDMKLAAAKQTRAVHLKMKQIDEIPTRIELVQYEKRFIELYDEVALTLDETRKYYCVYNTLKTTHEFLEKEISLINSINENFDVAMGSKTATQAFFVQIENIIQNVQGTVAKQKTARDDHQFSVEMLDSKYQLLLEQERMYVNAIREFQKECEKNEKLVARLEALAQQ
ncbi:Coiled-coil domain-containing protein 93 [Phytophthora pseudosyringae]|uniref:Coiled-coil domain-containing protein 93 n=1 Tax=Phytophthora pseudosyringae TaxID=221518 RepID=A0A8T1VS67_9STRA|nr:Coiled-coil domain-containing protein 93 [Phytophthora pseudosyringae]